MQQINRIQSKLDIEDYLISLVSSTPVFIRVNMYANIKGEQNKFYLNICQSLPNSSEAITLIGKVVMYVSRCLLYNSVIQIHSRIGLISSTSLAVKKGSG